MIKVFVGSAPQYAMVEPVMAGCIRDQASRPVEITFMRAGELGLKPSGCTGFTMYRYAVASLMGRQGTAIYLDVDMFLFADIAELWELQVRNRWACMQDGSTEVMVIDCAAGTMPGAQRVHQFGKGSLQAPLQRVIPPEWNHEDILLPSTKLLHFTNMALQPWCSGTHPLQDVWEELNAEYG